MKINYILFVVLMLLFLAGCNSSISNNGKGTLQISMEEQTEKNKLVEIKLLKQTNEVITLELTNLGTEVIEYGAGFQLERLNEDGWEEIKLKENIAIPSILHSFKPGEKREVVVSFEDFNHKITEGTYRFSMRFNIQDGKDFTTYAILKITN